MAMLAVAVLLGLSLALMLTAKIAKTLDMSHEMFVRLGILCCVAAGAPLIYASVLHARKDLDILAIAAVSMLVCAVIDLIEALKSKDQAIPPRVPVKRPGRGRVAQAAREVADYLLIGFVFYLTARGPIPDLERMSGLDMFACGCFTTVAIIKGYHSLFQGVEICGNGLLDVVGSRPYLRPWEAYESFYWTVETEDGVQLRLQAKSPDRKTSPLTVRFEDREAVRQILEANFPDQSSGDYDGLHRRTSCPCVRVRRTRRSRFTRHIVSFLCWPAVVLLTFYLWRRGVSLEVFSGIGMASILVTMGVNFWTSEKIEICRNGLLLGEKLRPWDQFECFFWEGETEDGAELRLPLKTYLTTRSISVERLVVAPENRETVRRLLEANLEDRSADSEAYGGWPLF